MNKPTSKQIQEARAQLWYQGDLSWKLGETQKRMVSFYKDAKTRIVVYNIGRRCGKSRSFLIAAFELCLRTPKRIVKYVTMDKSTLWDIVIPEVDKLLEDCPPEIQPKFDKRRSSYIFPNGSAIQLRGTDGGHHRKLRGGDSHLCIVDEAGFVQVPLEELLQDVLVPTTLLTKGKIILSSTTPVEPDHSFFDYMEYAESKDTLFQSNMFDLYEESKDSPGCHLTPELMQDFIEQYPGGMANKRFRREVLNERVRDENKIVVPEFTEDVERDVVVPWQRPKFFDTYTSMDIGFSDLTGVLFAYYDFDNAVTVIEDELVMNGPTMTTDKLAENIRNKEKALWTNPMTGEFTPPYRRVADNNLILLNDLQRLHNLTFVPTQKDNKEQWINNLRMELMSRRVYINPRCKTLIAHLKNATWNSTRKDYTRSPDNGHYDLLDSLSYLLRNIDKGKNPYPRGYTLSQMGASDNLVVIRDSSNTKESYKKINEMFLPKSSFRKS